jgi:hypothetical protein
VPVRDAGNPRPMGELLPLCPFLDLEESRERDADRLRWDPSIVAEVEMDRCALTSFRGLLGITTIP